MASYLLAHDLGTSGNKAVLYGINGTAVAEASASYPTYYPQERAAEQDPEAWWGAFCDTNMELLSRAGCRAEDILAVSFSAQMNSCLPVDRAGNPLRRAMIWADQRAQEQAERVNRELGMERVYQMTGQRLSASSGLSKMAWFRENEPELYKKTAAFLQPKDYLISKLTGRLVSDYSDASHLACLDITALRWSNEMLAAAGIGEEKLPELLPSTAKAGKVTREAAAACGLKEGTPVVTGGGDGPCATAGAGIFAPGQSYCCLGTSAWIASLLKKPHLDTRLRTFNLVFLDGRQVMALGATQAAGLALAWAIDTLYAEFTDKGEVYKNLDTFTRDVPAGSQGLLFLPYLLGERSPWWNADATGCFIGLTARQSRNDMLRAVMEGVGLNLRLILDILSAGLPIREMSLLGGVARDSVFAQLLSDVWQRELHLPAMPEYATSAGAALCAGIGAGVYKGFEDAARLNPVRETVKPNRENGETYQKALARFTALYHALKPVAFSGN